MFTSANQIKGLFFPFLRKTLPTREEVCVHQSGENRVVNIDINIRKTYTQT